MEQIDRSRTQKKKRLILIILQKLLNFNDVDNEFSLKND